MGERLIARINQLKRELRSSRLRESELEQLLDEQKACKTLGCPICLEDQEKWLSAQCGHLICHACVLHLMERDALFNKPCPLCQAAIKSIAVSYLNLA